MDPILGSVAEQMERDEDQHYCNDTIAMNAAVHTASRAYTAASES